MNFEHLKMDERMKKKLQMELVLRIVQLEQTHAESFQAEIDQLYRLMDACSMDYKKHKTAYHKQLNRILENLKKDHGMIPKGSLVSAYMSIGMAIGVAIGVALNQSNPGMYSIGIGVGLVFGAGMGHRMEKEKEKEGKLF